MNAKTPIELRQAIIDDLRATGPYSGQPIEIASDHLLEYVFTNVDMNTWCKAVGVVYEINKEPDPAFRSKTTIIFTCLIKKEQNEERDL